MTDADSRLLEKLLILAEEDSENFFKYTRHGAEWRREVTASQDEQKALLQDLKTLLIARRHTAPIVTRTEFKHLIIKLMPWVLAAIEAIAHVVRSVH